MGLASFVVSLYVLFGKVCFVVSRLSMFLFRTGGSASLFREMQSCRCVFMCVCVHYGHACRLLCMCVCIVLL